MDLLASLRYEGYSYADQTISELSAIGAPTRSLWVPLGVVYAVLVIAFGFGVWASSAEKRALRIVSGLVIGAGLLSLVAWPFAPMHQREVLAAGGSTVSDTMHLVLAGVNSLLFLLMIGVGAMALGKRFRRFSLATLLVVLVFGALTGLGAANVQANESTPWLGIKERLAVEGSMLWMAILGIALLRVRRRAARSSDGA
jgi:EamA domain-containing membrane protein RarD